MLRRISAFWWKRLLLHHKMYLSAYMGHAELTSTLYYVHLLPEKLRSSKGIDWDMLTRIYGKGVPENEDQG